MLLNLLINAGSSRPSTILTIYLYLLQVIAYPTLATVKTKARKNKNKYRAEAKRGTGTSNQAIPRTYDEIVTRATKIRYVGTSSVAIVRC